MPRDEETMDTFYELGILYRTVTEQLTAVQQRVETLGQERARIVRRMHALGYSHREIGFRLGLSSARVGQIMGPVAKKV